MDQPTSDRTAAVVPQTLDRELRLVREAIAMVAVGRRRRASSSAGLRFGEALLPAGRTARGRTPASGSCRCGRADEAGARHRGRAGRRMTDASAASLLIVEDDESLRRIVARHLRGQGYAVDEAGVGRGGRGRPGRRAAARRSSCST